MSLHALMQPMLRTLIALALTSGHAAAQDVPIPFPLSDILGLAAHAHLDAGAFERDLADALPITPHSAPAPDVPPDPFLWSLNGRFGGRGDHPRPGAIFGCARYGLGTRELFAEHGLTARETFLLMGYARPQFDDDDVWPEGAVARLYCSFVWDDARVVEILPEAATRIGLAQVFTTLTSLPQTSDTQAVYGEDGFRIDALNGPDDSVVRIESARMTLTLGHQSLTFRSFLMGGGV